jgi:hypothetical protein
MKHASKRVPQKQASRQLRSHVGGITRCKSRAAAHGDPHAVFFDLVRGCPVAILRTGVWEGKLGPCAPVQPLNW